MSVLNAKGCIARKLLKTGWDVTCVRGGGTGGVLDSKEGQARKFTGLVQSANIDHMI